MPPLLPHSHSHSHSHAADPIAADPMVARRKQPLGPISVVFLLLLAVGCAWMVGIGAGFLALAAMGWSGNFFSLGGGVLMVGIGGLLGAVALVYLRRGRSRRMQGALMGGLVLVVAGSLVWIVAQEPEYQGSGRVAADTPMPQFLPTDAQDVRFVNRPGVYKECEFPYGEAAFLAWMERGEVPFSEELVMTESPGGWRGIRNGSSGGYTSIAWDRDTGRVTIKVQSH